MRDWKIGDIIEERWEVFGAARGGMGQVYFVRDAQWGGAPLAVKSLLFNKQPPSNRAKALFLRESQVWLDLGAHPNIVSGFYTIEVDGILRFFMEYVPGEALSTSLSRGKPSLARALDLALQIAIGLEYVHAKDVVHRDLKPQNCIVSDGDTLRVTDFGLSKQLTSQESESNTEHSALANLSAAGLGTPLYMAPEQWSGLTNAKQPADVYSFGIVLYELLGGVHPFGSDSDSWRRYSDRSESKTLLELLESPSPPMLAVLQLMHQEVQPISLSELGVQAPAALLSLASRCLEKSPSLRPSFREIKQELLFLYNQLLKLRYPRSIPPPMRPITSGENNRAVSYFVMKQTNRAKEILSQQARSDPNALYITLNEKLLRLSCGETSPTTTALEIDRFLRLMHPSATHEPQILALQKRLSSYLLRQPIATAFSFDREQQRIMIGCADGNIHLYDASTRQRRLCLQSNREPVRSISSQKALIAASFEDKRVMLFDTMGQLKQSIPCGKEVSSLSLSANGLWLSVVSHDKYLRIFDTQTGSLLYRTEPHEARLTTTLFSPRARYLATASFDRTVKLWSFSRSFLGWRLSLVQTIEHEEAITCLCFSADETLLLSADTSGLLLINHLKEGRTQRIKLSATPLSLAISPEQKSALVGCLTGELLTLSLDKQAPIKHWSGHQRPIRAVSFGDTEEQLFSASEEGIAHWSTNEPSQQWPLLLERGISASVQISQEQERATLIQQVERGDLSAIRRLEALRRKEKPRDAEILQTLHIAGARHGLRDGVEEVFVKKSFDQTQRSILGPSDHLLLFTTSGASLTSTSHAQKRSLQGHTQEVLTASFSQDGAQLITGAKDNTARLWDELDTNLDEPLFPARSIEHPSWVTAACLVRRDFFATACQKRVYFWRLGESSPRWEAESSAYWVTSLFVSDDGERLFACASNGSYLCLSLKDGSTLFQSNVTNTEEFTTWKDLYARSQKRPLVYSGDKLLCAIENDLLLRDAKSNQGQQWLRGAAAPIRGMALSQDHQRIVAGSIDKRVYLFDANGDCAHVLQEHQLALLDVAISPDGALIATSEEAQQVRLYTKDGALLSLMEIPFDGESIDFDPSGRFLLAQGENQARLWEIISSWRLP